MSGRDVLNADQHGPLQLPMFMRATDLTDSLTGTLDRSTEPVDDVMLKKLYASKGRAGHGHGTGVYKSVEEHGVLNPVQMVHGEGGSLMMGQGHHRVAAATDIEHESRVPTLRGGEHGPRQPRDMWIPMVHTDARERTANPVNAYSDMPTKRAVIKDYFRWRENTPAIGHDVGWLQSRQDW